MVPYLFLLHHFYVWVFWDPEWVGVVIVVGDGGHEDVVRVEHLGGVRGGIGSGRWGCQLNLVSLSEPELNIQYSNESWGTSNSKKNTSISASFFYENTKPKHIDMLWSRDQLKYPRILSGFLKDFLLQLIFLNLIYLSPSCSFLPPPWFAPLRTAWNPHRSNQQGAPSEGHPEVS